MLYVINHALSVSAVQCSICSLLYYSSLQLFKSFRSIVAYRIAANSQKYNRNKLEIMCDPLESNDKLIVEGKTIKQILHAPFINHALEHVCLRGVCCYDYANRNTRYKKHESHENFRTYRYSFEYFI